MKQEMLEPLINYIHDNYYNDADKISSIKMIGVMLQVGTPDKIPDMIDKIALFNGFKKSYPPKSVNGVTNNG